MLIIHHKAKDGASGTASEAFEDLPVRIHREGRAALLVEWTERFVRRSGTLQRKVRADHLHDVICRRNLLDGFFGDAGHEDFLSGRKTMASG